jgi:amidase
MDLTELSASAIARAIGARQVSCRELMSATLARIDAVNPTHNAIVSLRDGDALLREADARDAELARGESRGWMHGLPQAIKDIAPTAGMRTTLGSPLLRDNVPTHDGLMVQRMKAAGCIVIGKTNTPEFGLGSHTFNEVFGVTRNAFDASRSAGGSSGGAAVALATHMLSVADGSDFMGSLRNPAGWNNVFGLRPSQGRVPLWPAPDVWVTQLGTEGPMGRTVEDVARLLDVQAGPDARVPLSLATHESFAEGLDGLDAKRVRVGWLGDLDGYLPMEAGVLDVCELALGRLQDLGCAVEPTPLGHSPEAVWQAWLVWRRWLVAARIAPFLLKPANRALIERAAQHVLPAHADPVRALRRARAAQRASLALRRRAALADANCWPRDGHLPPLDGGRDLRDLRRPALHQRAGRVQRRGPADGPAIDRAAAGRRRAASACAAVRRCRPGRVGNQAALTRAALRA